MTIDNFDLIGKMICRKADHLNDFWFVNIIKRRKDNPDLPRDCKWIDNFFVNGSADLLLKKDRIIEVCELNNARAYIHLNKRNYEKVAIQTLRILADVIASKNYEGVKSAFTTACGRYHSDDEKSWIVDIDFKDRTYNDIADILVYINEYCSPQGDKLIADIPTVSGRHFITKPFNLKQFKEKFPTVDVHRDNPTVLYFNNDRNL